MEKETGSRSFGSFNGVFVPTFLGIIGVILFLRLGYIVGAAGVVGALAIILLAVSVTVSTGLSLSSITSNIRIGAGGAYSIISKTLGLEVGGSVGIPLFLAQLFSVALYVLGFAEAWSYFFPSHNFVFVALGAFLIIFVLSLLSTRLAVKAQVVVMGVVCFSLFFILLSSNTSNPILEVPLISTFEEMPFWTLFALFFPAVTGLMAGIGLSGELSDPKSQIPKGVMTALVLTTFIYIGMVFWFWFMATPEQLITDSLILVNLTSIPGFIVAGILAATFSSAMTTFVAAPRVLQALGKDKILPFSEFFSAKSKKGEPKNAILISGLIVVNLLIYGSFNLVAQILTIFFLIAYALINISVFIEQTLALTSFRPTFKAPRVVPLFGAVASIIFMFLISVIAGLIAMVFIFVTYFWLVKKNLEPAKGDVRSGLFRGLSEWAAQTVSSMPGETSHVWKPNLLLPVVSANTLYGNFPLIRALVYPHGTMTVLGFKLLKNRKHPEENSSGEQTEDGLAQLPKVVKKFENTGIFTSFSMVEVEDYVRGLIVSMGAIESQVFPPNILFLPYTPGKLGYPALKKIADASWKTRVGLVLIHRDPEIGLGSEEDIHIWITPRVLKKDFYEERVFDLAMLLSFNLYENWKGRLTLWMCVREEDKSAARSYLKKLLYEARYPTDTKINIQTSCFINTLEKAPAGDLHVIPFRANDISTVREISKIKNKSFMFVLDSSREDILS